MSDSRKDDSGPKKAAVATRTPPADTLNSVVASEIAEGAAISVPIQPGHSVSSRSLTMSGLDQPAMELLGALSQNLSPEERSLAINEHHQTQRQAIALEEKRIDLALKTTELQANDRSLARTATGERETKMVWFGAFGVVAVFATVWLLLAYDKTEHLDALIGCVVGLLGGGGGGYAIAKRTEGQG